MKRVGKSVLVTVTVEFSLPVPQKFVCILDEISMLMFDVVLLAGKGFSKASVLLDAVGWGNQGLWRDWGWRRGKGWRFKKEHYL